MSENTERERKRPNPALENMTPYQRDCKLRCARYLLDMIEKYGAEILEEQEKEKKEKNLEK